MSNETGAKAREAGESATLEFLARVGLIAYGVVHIVIGILAFQIAWGGSTTENADLTGALRTLGDQPLGGALLWIVAVGLVALALWQASEAIFGHPRREGLERVRRRVTSGVKALFYAALGASAIMISLGNGSSGAQSKEQAISGILAWPGGTVVVVVAGLITMGIGVAGVIQGVVMSFREKLDTSSLSVGARVVLERLGQTGYIVKGLVLLLVGGMVGYAAIAFDRKQASGLNDAVSAILAQPFGRFLLTALALGFAAFGLFTIGSARYRRM
jgi:hypothetical protein